MRKLQYLLLALALVCVVGVSIRGALSYFTSYAEAEGGMILDLQEESSKKEVFDGIKHLTIKNTSKTLSVYVRAKAIITEKYADSLTCTGEDWRDGGDGYYYYNKLLPAGAEATPLDVAFSSPEAPGEGDEFNVAIIYETIPAQYDNDGNPVENWNQKIDIVTTVPVTEGGN